MNDVDSSIMELKKVVSLLRELKNYRKTERCSDEFGIKEEAWSVRNDPP